MRPDPQPPERAAHPRGLALFEELKWVHRMVRADLATVRSMADEVLAGLPAAQLQAGLRSLATNGPLWLLRVNCLHYCRFVHSHHQGESHLLFPAVRRSDPSIGPVVDRLETDHAEVAVRLREVEDAADELVREDTPAARRRITETLTALAEHLLVHLDYEEQQLGPVLSSWDGWPLGG